MLHESHSPVHIREFNGFFARGTADVVPLDHFIDCLNIRYDQLGVLQRGGISAQAQSVPNNVVRVMEYVGIDNLHRLLVLTSAGEIYDVTASTTIPILNDTWTTGGITDFSAVTLFYRSYITPHDRVTGITGGLVWVYDPTSVWGTISTIAINSGGAGYTVNDVLTLTGGTFSATITVNTVAAGVITAATITVRGNGYKATVANAVTGGTGAGATFDTTILPSARKAGGVKPTSAPAVVVSATAGNIELGLHLFRVAYETESGFVTQGNETPTQYTATVVNRKADVSSIPLGPPGTGKRHILATKIVTNYSGRADDYEFFFVPNGEIADNTTTTLTVNFFDNDLVSSADYLLDQLETIEAGVFINSYQGSMMVGGEQDTPSVVRVSKPGEPESFSEIDGFLLINPGDAGQGVKNGVEYRDLYFIFKSERGYVTKNNGAEPAVWDVNQIDSAIGTECFGVSKMVDSQGNTMDRFIIADRSGLHLYDGAFKDKTLAWKIEDYWNRISDQYRNQVQVCIDPVKKLIYVNIPLDAATSPDRILFADYKNGLDPVSLRWGIDTYTRNPSTIWVRSNRSASDIEPKLELASNAHTGLYIQLDANTFDVGDAAGIPVFFETAKVNEKDTLVHTQKLNIRAKGNCVFNLTLKGMDDVESSSLQDLTLTASPGKNYLQLADFTNEKISIRVEKDLPASANNTFTFNRLTLYIQDVAEARPL